MKEALPAVLCESDAGADLKATVRETRAAESWEGSLRSRLTGKYCSIRSGISRFVLDDGYSECLALLRESTRPC